jgi:hypothetical protein
MRAVQEGLTEHAGSERQDMQFGTDAMLNQDLRKPGWLGSEPNPCQYMDLLCMAKESNGGKHSPCGSSVVPPSDGNAASEVRGFTRRNNQDWTIRSEQSGAERLLG